MIYAVDPKTYPQAPHFIEELIYKDENDFEWRIARIKNGFMVKYFGPDYFKDSTFECITSKNKHVRVKNTNCIFFQDSAFETFCLMRDILNNGYTDDIWEALEELFTERFECSDEILESEIV